MISYLKGKILLEDTDYIILEANGVGYKVFVPHSMLRGMGPNTKESEVEVFCSLHLRKDETIELYGLPAFEALKLFEVLNNVSGIGPKAALLISSLGTPEEIRKAIDQRNTAFFQGVKGIGQKKIQKIILELTGKLGNFEAGKAPLKDDAVDSLISLGFSKSEAKEALSRVPSEVTKAEQRIKEALKLLGRT